MKEHPEIKWNKIIRNALIEYIEKLEIVDEIIAHSILKIEDVETIGKEIKEKTWEIHKKFLEEKAFLKS